MVSIEAWLGFGGVIGILTERIFKFININKECPKCKEREEKEKKDNG